MKCGSLAGAVPALLPEAALWLPCNTALPKPLLLLSSFFYLFYFFFLIIKSVLKEAGPNFQTENSGLLFCAVSEG